MGIRDGDSPCAAMLRTSWNVNSLKALTSERGMDKLAHMRRWLRDGVVCLQETHFEGVQSGRLLQALPGVEIADSPAVPTGRGGTSGGVAIIVPTFPGWKLIARRGPGACSRRPDPEEWRPRVAD